MIIFLASEVLKVILTTLFSPLDYENMISPFVPALVWERGRKLIRICGCVSGRRAVVTQGCVTFPTVILT